jgi:hypothetical protein
LTSWTLWQGSYRECMACTTIAKSRWPLCCEYPRGTSSARWSPWGSSYPRYTRRTIPPPAQWCSRCTCPRGRARAPLSRRRSTHRPRSWHSCFGPRLRMSPRHKWSRRLRYSCSPQDTRLPRRTSLRLGSSCRSQRCRRCNLLHQAQSRSPGRTARRNCGPLAQKYPQGTGCTSRGRRKNCQLDSSDGP